MNRSGLRWHQLAPQKAQAAFSIPKVLVEAERNIFFTDCDPSQPIPAEETCQILGLATATDQSQAANLYLGGFNLADLFELYDAEVVESAGFNFLEVIDGLCSLRRESGTELVSILNAYALELPAAGEATFNRLNQAEIDSMDLYVPTNYVTEFFQVAVSDSEAVDTVSLVRFSRTTRAPTLLGLSITTIDAKRLTDQRFDPFMHGLGYLTLNRSGLLTFSAMIQERLAQLIPTT